ncbi:MAG TPA: Qat anti-phage system associated protein QatB [Candidatus Elarobacter sp.]|nr:Qat anti-phage system associated protein QatB [Candidatus Elarobacter sp.]
MGTSNAFGGPQPSSQLIPDFLKDDEDDRKAVLSGFPVIGGAPEDEYDGDPVERESPENPVDLAYSRRAFTEYARFKESPSLERSLGRYVRDGLHGGTSGAARMARASRAAADVAGVLRTIQAAGVDAALLALNLGTLVGQSAREVFAAIIDAICPSVESIDDDLAREALFDCVLELNDLGIADIAELDEGQMTAFFTRFVCNAIYRRFMIDVSAKGQGRAPTDFAYESLERDVRDFIAAAVEGRVSREIDAGRPLSAAFTESTMKHVFAAAWDIVGALDEPNRDA